MAPGMEIARRGKMYRPIRKPDTYLCYNDAEYDNEVIPLKKVGIMMLAAALAIGLHMPPAMADQPLDTIQIAGVATRTVDPDMATVQFSFEKQGKTVEEVRQAGADSSSKFMHAMLAQGIDRNDISTSYYDVSPRYSYDRSGRQNLVGYAITQGWSVKVKKLDQLGSVIDKGLASGINRVDQVQFGLQNEDLFKRQLLAQAVENAKYTAQAVANAGGRGLGVLREASIPSTSVVAQPLVGASLRMNKMESANAATPTELAPKALTISVRVNTLFALN